MARFPVGEWLVSQARVTAFPVADMPDPSARQWWVPVFNVEPEARVAKPRGATLEEAGTIEQGVFAGGRARLIVASDPRRVDWRLVPHEADLAVAVPESVGSLPEVSQAFTTIVARWLQLTSVPPLKRLAFGVVLFHPHESRQAVYTQLVDYLPVVQIDPANSTDLLYQINRPRTSAILAGTSLNRLSKWSAATTQLVPVLSGDLPTLTVHSARLEIDANTPAERQDALPAEQIVATLEELRNLAVEIATQGDAA